MAVCDLTEYPLIRDVLDALLGAQQDSRQGSTASDRLLRRADVREFIRGQPSVLNDFPAKARCRARWSLARCRLQS